MQERRLAAIMFTDIVGYTALMQQDEAVGIETRKRHRQIFNEATAKYNGKILQYYGDGTLSIFASAVDAVECGLDMQLKFQKEPKIPVRIGIHPPLLCDPSGFVCCDGDVLCWARRAAAQTGEPRGAICGHVINRLRRRSERECAARAEQRDAGSIGRAA